MNDDIQEYSRELKDSYRHGRIDRRDFIKWSAMLGITLPRTLDFTRVQAARSTAGRLNSPSSPRRRSNRTNGTSPRHHDGAPGL